MGPKKYCLKKTKIFHPFQSGPVYLPSEYESIRKYDKEIDINYKVPADTLARISYDDDGNEIWVKIMPSEKQPYNRYITLYSFADTVKLAFKEFCDFSPYIKSNNKKRYFCSYKINYLYKDTLGEVTHLNMFGSNIFSFWRPNSIISDNEKDKLKQTYFILTDLYYTKGNATYFFDREFIIVIK